MKNKLIIFGIGLLVLSGCGTSANFMADDVYMVRPSKLPIGESSADETSYAAFLNRKEGENRDQQIYADDRNFNESRRCLREPYWYDGCGCSLEYWSFYSPYSGRNRTTAFNPYYGMGYHNMMFSSNFPYAYPYYGSGFGFYNSMMLMNPGYGGYYGMGWGTSYGYNPYGFGSGYGYYGYSNWGYGYGGNGGHNNSTFSSGITHSGPRGSASGYANPNGRATSGQPLKIGSIPANNGHQGSTSVKPTRSVKPVESTSTYRSPSARPTSVTRTNGTTSTPTRTYQNSSAKTPTRTYNNNSSTGVSGRSGTYNSSSGSSTRQSSGSSYESRGSSSGSSSSGSSSRSGGSSSGSSSPSPGRRN